VLFRSTKDTYSAFKEELIAIAENRSFYDFESKIKTIDGIEKFIHLNWTVVSGYEETLEKVYISTIDITDRKRAEEEKNRYSEEIEQSYQGQQIINTLLRISIEDNPLEDLLADSLETILSVPFMKLSPKGGIFLADGKNLKLTVHKNLPSVLQNMCKNDTFGCCLYEQAAQSKTIQFANCLDKRNENTYDGITEHGHYIVPILHHNKVLGVIVLYLKHGHVKSEIEEDFLKSVANTIAGLIDRQKNIESKAELEKQIRRNQKLETVGTMAGGIAHEIGRAHV